MTVRARVVQNPSAARGVRRSSDDRRRLRPVLRDAVHDAGLPAHGPAASRQSVRRQQDIVDVRPR